MSTTRRYIDPRAQLREYLDDPFRLFIILAGVFVLCYGTRKGVNSPFEYSALDHLIGDSFTIVDVVLLAIFALEIVRRIVLDDLAFDRSHFTRPLVALAIVCGLVPLFRMFIVEQGIRVPLELMYLPTAIGSFFIWKTIMRREELPVMIWMVIGAGLFKSFEGLAVFAINRQIGWGLLTGWRDAMLTTMMLLGGFFAYIVKPADDPIYRRIRFVLLAQLPLTIWIVMSSMRRSYMLAAVLTLPILFLSFDRSERRSAVGIFLFVVLIAVASVFMADASAFSDRFNGIVEPSTDGSSAYRLIENYNVGLMILDRPIFGWPMATFSENRTLIDFENISFLMPHNVYLYVMFRAGIFGLLAYLWLMGTMVATNYRTIRASRRPMERFLSFWLTSVTVLTILTGLTTPVFADRLQYFLPFLMLMMGYLPGAWPARALRHHQPTVNSLDYPAATPTS